MLAIVVGAIVPCVALAPHAQAKAGGVQFAEKPVIQRVDCRTLCVASSRAARQSAPAPVRVKEGGLVRLRGQKFENVRFVTFLGRYGRADDRRVAPNTVSSAAVVVAVPKGAMSGAIQLTDDIGTQSTPSRTTVIVIPPPAPPPAEVQRSTGKFIWPVTNAYLSSPFGPRWGRLHAGIDLALPAGSPIRAAAAGVITMQGYTGGYGNYTCVAHRDLGLTTCYAHQSQYISRGAGQAVAQGQILGKVGCTGNCTGDHLHFEIRRGTTSWGTPTDPIPFMPAGGSRRMPNSAAKGNGKPLHFNVPFKDGPLLD